MAFGIGEVAADGLLYLFTAAEQPQDRIAVRSVALSL